MLRKFLCDYLFSFSFLILILIMILILIIFMIMIIATNYIIIIETIFMNTENSKTNESCDSFVLN